MPQGTKEKAASKPKAKMSKDERRAKINESRNALIQEAVGGRTWVFAEQISLEDNERFTDPSGNKAKHGFLLRQKGKPDVEVRVGKATLQRMVDGEFDVKVEGYPPPSEDGDES